MVKRPTRLRFTEDDLTDSKVKKAVEKAEKAADKADKAVDRLPKKKPHRKLSRAKHLVSRTATGTFTGKVHKAVSEHEDENVGVQAVHESERSMETAAHTVHHAVYSHKLKAYDKADKLVRKSDKQNINVLFEKFKKDNPEVKSNLLSRWKQKQAIKKQNLGCLFYL